MPLARSHCGWAIVRSSNRGAVNEAFLICESRLQHALKFLGRIALKQIETPDIRQFLTRSIPALVFAAPPAMRSGFTSFNKPYDY